MKRKHDIPEGWTENEIRDLAEFYDNQPEEDAIAEMENAQKLVPIESIVFAKALKLAQERKTTVEKVIKVVPGKGE